MRKLILLFPLPLLLPAATYAEKPASVPAPSEASVPAPSEGSSATILVTATKQNATLLQTPASADVLRGDTVSKGEVTQLSDVAQRVPNVSFTNYSGANASINIRGLGFSDDEADTTSVGVLLDGVPIQGTIVGTLFDLDQIEVLRGPQSTLYGQNSMGGLVALRSRDPGFVWGGSAQASYGTGNERRLEAAIDVPLGPDTALRLSGGYDKADGYIRNLALGRDNTAGWRSWFGRAKLLHRDRAGGTWRLSLHHVDSDGGNDVFAPTALAARHQSQNGDAGRNDLGYTFVTGSYDRSFANGNRLSVNAGGGSQTWSYWLPQSLYGGASGYDARTTQYSIDARLAHTPAQGPFDWMVGVYGSLLRKRSPYLFDVSGYYTSDTMAHVRGDTLAAYGELGWRIAPRLRLAAALRVEHDDRRLDWVSRQSGAYDSDGDGIPDATYASTETITALKVHDTVPLPRLTLEFRPDAHQFLWATLARGYKASGYNIYATDAASISTPFRPEYGDYAELGYRVSDLAHLADLSLTGFYTKLRDQQVVTIGDGGQSLVSNAGRSHNLGFEATAALRPARGVELNGFAGYVHAVYDDYASGGISYDGQRFPNTPAWSYGAGVKLTPITGLEASLSARHVTSANLYPTTAIVNPAYTLLDAGISYRIGHITLGVTARNLTDATYYTRAVSQEMVVAARPRTIMGRIAVEF